MKERNLNALDYAKLGCDTLIKKFVAEDLPPKGGFHYHQGVFLSGMNRYFHITKDEKYRKYIKDWVDSIILSDGTITKCDATTLDDLQSGILLYDLYEETNDNRYKIALDTLAPMLKKWKSNEFGGFWHKEEHQNQMWLDGIYMAGPLGVMYGAKFGDGSYFDLITLQARLMFENIRDEKTGLLYHGWDCTKQAEWANPTTGCSKEFWGRALGWYCVALCDILDYIPNNQKPMIIHYLKSVLEALFKFQDEETGLWYQVLNKGNDERNWLESSCTCLYLYSYAKAIRKGYIGNEYSSLLEKGFNGIVDKVQIEDGSVELYNVCIGTGISDFDYYVNRPTAPCDLHGMGAFVLMCTEYHKYECNKII